MAVVRTKLGIPPLARWILSRERLLGRLSGGEGGGRPVVLVSAPAGYGKTSLLACWARSRPGPTAWLALDREDDDPSRLAAAMEAAVRAAGEEASPSAAGKADIEAVEPVARLVDLLVARRGLALVLDDVHLLKSRGALGLLSSLIERLPDGVRILLAARSDPRISLARLRSRGLLEELRAEDLRLRPAEAAAVASALGAPALEPEESALLEARTEGWAAGVALAAMNLAARAASGGKTAAVALLRDTRAAHRWALDYLLEEVLDRVPEETEDFLVRSSVLERFSAPLAEAVLCRPPPGGSLQALARDALFLSPVDGAETWWRYHPLFSELLLVRLRETRPGLEAELRLRAADWLESSGFAEEAAAQLLAAGKHDRAAGLVEAAAEGMMARGEIDALLRHIDALPPEALDGRPSLRATRAWCLFFRGSPIAQFLRSISGADAEVIAELGRLYRGEAEGVAERIDELLEPSDGSLTRLTWAGRYLAYLSSVSARYELGRKSEAEAILGRLRLSESPMLSLGALFFMATALVRSGELGRAYALLAADMSRAAAADFAGASPPSALPALGRHYVLMGEILLYKGKFEESEDALLAGIARLERIGAASSMNGLLLLARLRALRGEESANLMERARRLAADFDFTDLDDRAVLACEAKIALIRGDRRLARRLLDALPPPPEDPALAAFLERHPVKYERLEKARLLAAEGRFEAALSVLAALRDVSLSAGRPFLLIDVELLRALAFDGLGRAAEAETALEEALARAAPEEVLLPFIESGEPAAALLSRRLDRIPPALAAFAQAVLAAVEGFGAADARAAGAAGPASPGGPGGILLSSREREVLSFLSSELSTAEIGERLYLSENTIKSHMKSLYAKLEAHSRAAAWARASELGLLPRGR